MELYLDLGDAKPATYGPRQFRYGFRWGGKTAVEAQSRTAGVVFATSNLGNRYQVEAAIPWATLGGPPEAGAPLGLDVMVDDDDGAGHLDGKLAWSGYDDRARVDPRRFGDARLGRGVPFNATNSPPRIDGNPDSVWNQQPQYPLRRTVEGTAQVSNDIGASFAGLWDATNLYLYVDVRDNVRATNTANGWFSDAVEVFIDGTHARATGFGEHDLHFTMGHRADAGAEVNGRMQGVQFGQVDTGTPGYRVELSVPWALLGSTPEEGTLIGFDILVDDSDGADAGFRRIALFADGGEAPRPINFGTAELRGLP